MPCTKDKPNSHHLPLLPQKNRNALLRHAALQTSCWAAGPSSACQGARGWCWKDRAAALRKCSFCFWERRRRKNWVLRSQVSHLLAPKLPGCLDMPQICDLLAGQRPDAVPEHVHR